MRYTVVLGLLLALAACTQTRITSVDVPDGAAIETALLNHIEILADDQFGGRRPGTDGEVRTLRYLVREWQAAGLQSGTNDPSNPWFAPVQLAISPPATGEVSLFDDAAKIDLPPGAVTVFSSQRRDLVDRAPMVFLTSDAPVDPIELTGKAAVVRYDGGQSFERIERLAGSGVAAVIVFADRGALDPIIEARNAGGYRLAGEDQALAPLVLVDRQAALAQPGITVLADELRARGAAPSSILPLPFEMSLDTQSAISQVTTHNLVGRLPGRDPDAGAVLLMAHWDHFGECGEEGDADRICNGAVDNASGLAMLTELARLLGQGPALDRDVYFLATTAEEWGLLGATAFTREPALPLETIVAAFNLDTSALAPRGSPVAIVGEGFGPLDAEVRSVIASAGGQVAGEDIASAYVRRQDGWAFIQADVPTLMVSSSFADRAALERYTRERYHRASDEVEGIELGGAAQDLLIHLALVRHFATIASHPGGKD